LGAESERRKERKQEINRHENLSAFVGVAEVKTHEERATRVISQRGRGKDNRQEGNEPRYQLLSFGAIIVSAYNSISLIRLTDLA
jgi:hypothetical protein